MTRQEPNQLTHEAAAMSSDGEVLMQFSTPRTAEASTVGAEKDRKLGIPAKPNAKSGMIPNGIPG
jgi:hypothetical protein